MKTAQAVIVEDFIAATKTILEWYDGGRPFETERTYNWLPADATHGMTALRTAMQKAQRAGYGPTDVKYMQLDLMDEGDG